MFAVQGFRGAKVHGNAVLHHAILIEDLVKHAQWAPAIDHEIFRDDFEPIDDRLLLENMPIVRNAQPNANAEVGVSVKTICRHKCLLEDDAAKKTEDQRLVSAGPPV